MNPRDMIAGTWTSTIPFDASKLGALMMQMQYDGEEVVLHDHRPLGLKLEVIDNMLDLG